MARHSAIAFARWGLRRLAPRSLYGGKPQFGQHRAPRGPRWKPGGQARATATGAAGTTTTGAGATTIGAGTTTTAAAFGRHAPRGPRWKPIPHPSATSVTLGSTDRAWTVGNAWTPL